MVPVCCLIKVDSDTDSICLFSLRGDFDLVPLGSDSWCFTSLAEAIAQIPQSKKKKLIRRERQVNFDPMSTSGTVHSLHTFTFKERVTRNLGFWLQGILHFFSQLLWLKVILQNILFKTRVYQKYLCLFIYSFIHYFIMFENDLGHLWTSMMVVG